MNNKIIYGIIILCIVFTILIGASVLSTGYKIADFLLALFLSAIGLYLMYKNIETAKVAPDPNPNSSSGIVDNENLDNENIDKTLLGVQEMLKVKMSYEIIISKFESSLSNMQTLENNIYLEKYKEYKNKINDELKILQDLQTLDHNKNFLTELINTNIYIQTINKYNDKYNDKNNEKIDENYDNINQLFNHFINYFIKKYDTEPYNIGTLSYNVIENLQKLQTVILSMKDNNRYKLQFNSLITIASGNKELEYHSELKTILTNLRIDITPAGKGEGDGKNNTNNAIECFNSITSKLKPKDGNLDTLKTSSYNELIKKTKEFINNKHIDGHKYVQSIKPLFFDNIKAAEISNLINAWIETCIIPDNN